MMTQLLAEGMMMKPSCSPDRHRLFPKFIEKDHFDMHIYQEHLKIAAIIIYLIKKSILDAFCIHHDITCHVKDNISC